MSEHDDSLFTEVEEGLGKEEAMKMVGQAGFNIAKDWSKWTTIAAVVLVVLKLAELGAFLTMWWLVPIAVFFLPIPLYFLASIWIYRVSKRITFDDLDLD